MRVKRVPEITIFVRHSADCPHKKRGELFQDCKCRKHLRWFDGGQHRKSTGVRAWQEAEQKKQEVIKAYYALPPLEWYDDMRTKIDRLTTLVETLVKRKS